MKMIWHRQSSVFIFIVTIAWSRGALVKHDPDGEMSLDEKAQHYFHGLRDTLLEMGAFSTHDIGHLKTILTRDYGGNKTEVALSGMILRSLFSFCQSFHHHAGNESSMTINIFNNSTFNISPRSNKDKKKKKKDKEGKKEKIEKEEKEDGNTEEQPGTDRVVPKYSKYQVLSSTPEDPSSPSSSWFHLLAHPMRVTVRREKDDMVRVIFNVSRGEESEVEYSFAYGGEVIILKGPEEYGLRHSTAISSIVEFVYNASICNHPPTKHNIYAAYSKEAHFTFYSRNFPNNNDIGNSAFVGIETCFSINPTFYGEEEISQEIVYPTFMKGLKVSDFLLLHGKNTTMAFKVPISLGEGDNVQISSTFYDPDTDQIHATNVLSFSASHGTIIKDVDRDSKELMKILDGEVDIRQKFNGTLPGKMPLTPTDADLNQRSYVSATIKISMSLPNGDVSGKMLFRTTSYNSSEIVRTVGLNKAILFKTSHRKHHFLEGKFVITSAKKFVCGDKTNNYDFGSGHCLVYCEVEGLGLKSVTLRRKERRVNPVVTRVKSHSGFLFANLGLVRREVDGEYECEVTSRKRKPLRWTVEVRSWGHPKITLLSLYRGKNSTAFTCSAKTSRQPMELEVRADRGPFDEINYRIDEDPTFTKKVTRYGKQTTMALTIPNSFMKYPIEFISCHAKNIASETVRKHYVDVSGYPDYYAVTDYPHILANISDAIDLGNGSVSFSCVVDTTAAFDMAFYFDYPDNAAGKIEASSTNFISQTVEEGKTTWSLTVPNSSLVLPRSRLYCVALNEIGRSEMVFTLSV